MRVTFYSHACCVYERQDFRLLVDPWFVDGACEGSWFHYPQLKTSVESLRGVDAIVITRNSPDHRDEATLATFPRDLPILFLDHGPLFLKRFLTDLGFRNFITLKNGESSSIGPFDVTMYAPFQAGTLREHELGESVESALVVRAGTCSVFNAGDTVLTPDAAKNLRAQYGRFTLAQLNFGTEEIFPACQTLLGAEAKHAEVLVKRERHLSDTITAAKALGAEYLMPFASSYVIAGKQSAKNDYLGVFWPDDVAAEIKKRLPEQKTLLLAEAQSFDLARERMVEGEYRPVGRDELGQYIASELAAKKYPFEEEDGEELSDQNLRWLIEALPKARAQLWEYQNRLGVRDPLELRIAVAEQDFCFRLDSPNSGFVPTASESASSFWRCTLDLRLLRRILERRARWHEAELGCHIDFARSPDVDKPSLRVIMGFFHLPENV